MVDDEKYSAARALQGCEPGYNGVRMVWDHQKMLEFFGVGCTNRISVGINDRILTEDLSTINEGIPMGYIEAYRAQLS